MKEKNSLPSFLNVPNAISSSTRNVSSYLQRLITHSFHPQHPLWLVKRESLPDQNGCMCCSLCGEQLMLLVYRCLICDFKLDMSCAKNPPLLEIDHPKVDQHKLHLLHLCCLRVRRWSISLYVSTLQLHVPYPVCLLSRWLSTTQLILLALGRGLVDVDMSMQML